MAHHHHLPPSRYLRLGYPEWGETDFDLTQAYDFHEQNICSCGCGGWRPDCCDGGADVECTVDDTVCRGGAALGAWQKENPDPTPGTLLTLRWTTPTLSASEQSLDEIKDMYRRHGLPVPPHLT